MTAVWPAVFDDACLLSCHPRSVCPSSRLVGAAVSMSGRRGISPLQEQDSEGYAGPSRYGSELCNQQVGFAVTARYRVAMISTLYDLSCPRLVGCDKLVE